MKNFAVFVSGYGGNLQSIIDAVKKNKIKANLKVVISNKVDAFALERAKKAGIPSVFINPHNLHTREAFDQKAIEILKEYNVDFVVLAGYMKLLSSNFIKQYPNKILNIHPSLIPSFKGLHGIKDAFDYGVKVTGVTVHFVTEGMDEGAIIAQEVVKVSAKETLKSLTAKIHKLEHKMYPPIINSFALGSLRISGRKVHHRSQPSRL